MSADISASWPKDAAARCVKYQADTYNLALTRKDNFERQLTATISNFKVGVAYDRPFAKCTGEDQVAVYNDYHIKANDDAKSIKYATFSTNDAINSAVADSLYYNYPMGISYDRLNITKIPIQMSAYTISAMSGKMEGTKDVDTTAVTLANGSVVYVAKNYTQNTHDDVQAAISAAFYDWIYEAVSAKLFNRKYSHENVDRVTFTDIELINPNLNGTADFSELNEGYAQVRSRLHLSDADTVIDDAGHFNPLTEYGDDVNDIAGAAAAIYTFSDPAKKLSVDDIFKHDYFAVKSPIYKNITAVAGILTEFDNVKYVKKSIYNVGGYAGMLTMSDGFTLENTTAAYYCDNQNYRHNTDVQPNIMHFCRFGGLAAKAEIQTCNISNSTDVTETYASGSTYSHVLSAKNCAFYNNYETDERLADQISNSIIAEINYLRLPMPSIYQFSDGRGRKDYGKRIKYGMWIDSLPYTPTPPVISLWNNSVGSAAWPGHDNGATNPHSRPDDYLEQFATEHSAVNKLFRFEDCKVGLSNVANTADIASAYIPALNAPNLYHKAFSAWHAVLSASGTYVDGTPWTADANYFGRWGGSADIGFKCNTKVQAAHEYMAGDMFLLASNTADRTDVRMVYPTDHVVAIAHHANTIDNAITTAIKFTGSFEAITNLTMPESADIVKLEPVKSYDSYFTYTYDTSAISSNDSYINIDYPDKTLSYVHNFNITDMEQAISNTKQLLKDIFTIQADGYLDDVNENNTTMMRSTVSSVILTNNTNTTTSFDVGTNISLAALANIISDAVSVSAQLKWNDIQITTDAPVKAETDNYLSAAKSLATDNLAVTDFSMFKSIDAKHDFIDEQQTLQSHYYVLKYSDNTLTALKHGYVFTDALSSSDHDELDTEYFGNTIHIGVKYKPAYIRDNVSMKQEFVYSAAKFDDFAGLLLVDKDTKNLISYVDVDCDTLNNDSWSMTFDQATTKANTNFPYESSALLINITTEEE